jgi:hypothetical protein
MTTQRLTVDVPVDQHREFHVFAVSQGATMSDLVRRMVADEPMIERLREMVKGLDTETRSIKDLPLQPDSSYPTLRGLVWEYRLPSGRTASVTVADSGVFLSH